MNTEKLKELDQVTLVDMLAKHTDDYMHMLKAGGTKDEYERCKEWIKVLTKEIECRKGKPGQ